MQFGIYYAYWESAWRANYLPYIDRVKALGFDILEVGCGDLDQWDDCACKALRDHANALGIRLTGGYGPRPEHDISSPDKSIVDNALQYYAALFRKMELSGIGSLGGALYSYWPAREAFIRDKVADLSRSIENMQKLSSIASDHGIALNMESLNRFEGFLINTSEECINYVKAVDRPNVHVMLDTFHMNIEEDSIADAIRASKGLLGRLHVGEANRRPPHDHGRICWKEIGNALREIQYDGDIVMEPFVRMGGQVGADIALWHDLSDGADDETLDATAASSLAYLKAQF